MTINVKGELLSLEKPIVMAILNITPNSFFDGGKYNSQKEIIIKVNEYIEQGAQIIDVGACSTKPGSIAPELEEETNRIKTTFSFLSKEFPKTIFSIDTYRASVAELAIDLGASIINDVSGGNLDDEMFATAGKLQVPYILMHMKGNPLNMQINPTYFNCTEEVAMYFSEKINKLLELDVKDIILDPGFGFGKTLENNYELLRNLELFCNLGFPVLAGFSRKSMITKALEIKVEEALNGTTILNTMALQKGAKILRVHDVWAAREAIKLTDYLFE